MGAYFQDLIKLLVIFLSIDPFLYVEWLNFCSNDLEIFMVDDTFVWSTSGFGILGILPG